MSSNCSSGSCGSQERLPPGMLNEYDLDQKTAEGTLIWFETVRSDNGIRISDVSLEILSKVRSSSDMRIFGIVFGGEEIKSLYTAMYVRGVDTIYHVKDGRLSSFYPEAYADSIVKLSNRIDPAIILMGATPRGRELAPRVAALLDTGLTADCTALDFDGRVLSMTRPAFGGNLMATITCDTFPQMATIRPGVFPLENGEEGRKGTVIYWDSPSDLVKEILSSEHVVESESDIGSAKILISLGNGIKERSTVDIAFSVAERMNASVSCSRALVDKGWLPRNRQVGQSGRTVSPDIYIAFGISGSIQHKAGIGSARKIISVNTDPDAPIHEVSDISIIADANQVLRLLDKELKHP